MKNASSGKKILLGVTASISAYRALDLTTELRELGHEVHVVMTRDAGHFVTPLSLQSFSGTEVVQDFFSLEGRLKPVHIELAKKCDLIVIAPASADIIAKLAHGMADDVLSCTVLASTAPLVIVPSAVNARRFPSMRQAASASPRSRALTASRSPPTWSPCLPTSRSCGFVSNVPRASPERARWSSGINVA